MKITYNYTPTASDVYEAGKLHYLRSQGKYALIGLIVLYLFFLFRFSSFIISTIAIGVGMFVGIGFMWIYLRLYTLWFFKKTPHLHSPQTCTIGEDGLQGGSSFGSGEMKWGAYVRAQHNKKVLLLYLGRNLYQFIPKRAMTDGEWAELLKLVGNKLPGA